MTAGLLAGLWWITKEYDSWADLFPLLPFAALGLGAAAAVVVRRLPPRPQWAVTAVAAAACLALALHYSVTTRDDTLDLQREATDAVLAQLPEDATITSVEGPQPLVLTGRTNPTRYQMFRSGLQDYMEDTWPGGYDAFKRDLVADGPDLVSTGESVSLHLASRADARLRLRRSRAPVGVVRPRRPRRGDDRAPARGRRLRPCRPVRPAAGRPRVSRRAPVALAAGSVLSGLLAYVLFALLTRGLGAEAAAPVSVLWTLWAFASAALSFPLQHWITVSVVAGREDDVRGAARQVGSLVVGVSLGLGLVAWLLRDDLFHRDDAWFPVLVVLVMLACAAVGVSRGGLAGRGRFAAVAWSLVAENGLRCVLVGALLLADVDDPVIHGLAWSPADSSPCGRRHGASPGARPVPVRSRSSAAPPPDRPSRRSSSPADRCCWRCSAARRSR